MASGPLALRYTCALIRVSWCLHTLLAPPPPICRRAEATPTPRLHRVAPGPRHRCPDDWPWGLSDPHGRSFHGGGKLQVCHYRKWRHVSVMAPDIIGNSTVRSADDSVKWRLLITSHLWKESIGAREFPSYKRPLMHFHIMMSSWNLEVLMLVKTNIAIALCNVWDNG